MKTYAMCFGQCIGYKHDHPDRTAWRSTESGRYFQVWSNRKAMAKSIRMQQQRAPHYRDWHALVELTDGEGY